MQEYLPQVRSTAELKRKLELIAEGSVSKNLSDHIRYAVEKYVEANWTPELQHLLDEDERVPQLS